MADMNQSDGLLDQLNQRMKARTMSRLDLAGNLTDEYREVTQMENMRRQATRFLQMGATTASVFGNPFVQGMGMPINPISFNNTLTNAIGYSVNYQQLAAQSRAFLGADNFNTAQVDRFVDSLTKIGRTKSDVIGVMQQLATLSRQVSTGMAEASMSVLNFARANGLNAGVVGNVLGSAALSSDLKLDNRAQANQYLENIRQLSGRVAANFEPTANAVQGLSEMGMRAGFAPRMDSQQVSGPMHLMQGFLALNPDLYSRRKDIAAANVGDLMQAGKGLLLGMAIDVAAEAGKSTDLLDVLGYLDNPEDQAWMAPGLAKRVGRDRGIALASVLSTPLRPGFVQDLIKNPTALGTRFRPDGQRSPEENALAAQGATTNIEKGNASLINQLESTDSAVASVVNKVAEGVQNINVNTLLIGQAATGILSFLVTNPFFRGTVGSGGGGGGASDAAGRVAEVGTGVLAANAVKTWGPRIAMGLAAAATAEVTIPLALTAAAFGGLEWFSRKSVAEKRAKEEEERQLGTQELSSYSEGVRSGMQSVNQALRTATGGKYAIVISGTNRTQQQQDAAREKNKAAGATGSAPVGSRNPHRDNNSIDFQLRDLETGKVTDDPFVMALARGITSNVFPDIKVIPHGSASGTDHFHLEGFNKAVQSAAQSLNAVADSANRAAGAASAPKPVKGTR